MAGNITTKDFCINWIKINGGGIVGTNSDIDMVSEANGDNSNGLIEIGGNSIEFFTSSTNWKVLSSAQKDFLSYDELVNNSPVPITTITNNIIPSASGVYRINSNFVFENSSFNSNTYKNNIFNQIIYINGDLTIETDIETSDSTTAMYIVNGNVYIDEGVDIVYAAIITDGTFETAYNLQENKATSTLRAKGIYRANKFLFQRTLQGTNNSTTPSEEFNYQPKYLVQLKQYVGTNQIRWKSIE
jgi:hypothetical protein